MKENRGRSQKQLKEHYMNFLRPGINLEEWDDAEELKLIELVNKYGNSNWKKIQEEMPTRG